MSVNDLLAAIDVSTREKRRRAVSMVIGLLEHIRIAEEYNMSRFPSNLQNGGAFANAETSLEVVSDAIVGLDYAY